MSCESKLACAIVGQEIDARRASTKSFDADGRIFSPVRVLGREILARGDFYRKRACVARSLEL